MIHVAGFAMLAWTGDVPPMANTIEVRERVGTDGYTFVRRGKRSPAFTVRTRAGAATLQAARTKAADYEGLIGRFVTAEDPGGRGYSKIMVLGVTASVRPLVAASDGSRAVVDATWTLQRGR